ncbi:MAG TPA: penicillin acylase family protein, partial [Myxococcota bacterium]|nr:penicillin acylase family protein [Myxococcota bacterium]
RVAGGVLAAALALSAVAAFVVLSLVGRDPGPSATGELAVAGLAAPARIVRDPFGIPHVQAESPNDGFLALGFAHAQDRLWQMEVLRRSARGRLAEALGPRALDADRLARTLGFGDAAEEEARHLERDARAALDAYAAGVNAWLAEIAAGRATRPFELRWLELEPEPWTAADSLAIARLRAWNLGRSLGASLLLDRLVSELGGVPSRDFFPVRPSDGAHDPLAPLLELGRAGDELAAIAGLAGPSGSLGVLVPGSRSASGKPLLANDVHVDFSAPAVFYLAHVRAGHSELSGATWPGLPVFFAGANRALAWGQVALHGSVSDLFEETLDPAEPLRYERGGHWREASVRHEEIAVRGAAPLEIDVVWTEHGPLLHSVRPDDPRAGALALRWTGSSADSGVEALLKLQRCGDWDCFRGALRELHAPVATFLYADANGAIGTQVAGDLPIRAIDTALLPVSGASRFYDWRGTIPFEELPSSFGAKLEPQVVSTHVGAESFRHTVSWLWSSEGGPERVRELVALPGPFDVERLVAIQRDTVSRRGPASLRLLIGDLAPASSSAQRAKAMLLDWDGSTARDSVGASLYHVFRQRLAHRLLEHLGLSRESQALLDEAEPAPGLVLARTLDRIGRDKAAGLVEGALDETWATMRTQISANPKKWAWGEVHQLRLVHEFERSGSGSLRLIGRRLGVGPFSAPGDPDSPWTMYHGAVPDPAVELGPGLRYAVDLADPDHALVGLAGGQSGSPGSEHYADALADWLAGRPRPLWMHQSDIAYHQKGTWELRPDTAR